MLGLPFSIDNRNLNHALAIVQVFTNKQTGNWDVSGSAQKADQAILPFIFIATCKPCIVCFCFFT